MKSDRLLIIAVILIVAGLFGIVTVTLLSRYQKPVSPMTSMRDMMGGRMMGRGMMDPDHMKEMMQRMMPGMLPPGIAPELLPEPESRGARLLVRYCAQCHDLLSPAMHSAEEWPGVASRMFMRTSMMDGMMGVENPARNEQRAIVAYLQKHSLKPILPKNIPAPESQGAATFTEFCSQCHSLPDPKLHRGKEWPAIVDRMQSHMRSMGKKVITEREKKYIMSYLTRQGRT